MSALRVILSRKSLKIFFASRMSNNYFRVHIAVKYYKKTSMGKGGGAPFYGWPEAQSLLGTALLGLR